MFSFTWLVNMLHISQQEIFTISANFVWVFFSDKIEKEKKIHQDAAYQNEKTRLYSMSKN